MQLSDMVWPLKEDSNDWVIFPCIIKAFYTEQACINVAIPLEPLQENQIVVYAIHDRHLSSKVEPNENIQIKPQITTISWLNGRRPIKTNLNVTASK